MHGTKQKVLLLNTERLHLKLRTRRISSPQCLGYSFTLTIYVVDRFGFLAANYVGSVSLQVAARYWAFLPLILKAVASAFIRRGLSQYGYHRNRHYFVRSYGH